MTPTAMTTNANAWSDRIYKNLPNAKSANPDISNTNPLLENKLSFVLIRDLISLSLCTHNM